MIQVCSDPETFSPWAWIKYGTSSTRNQCTNHYPSMLCKHMHYRYIFTWPWLICICDRNSSQTLLILIWAVPCKNMSSSIRRQWRPRSACTFKQANQGLRCPSKELLDNIECINEEQKPGWDFAHAHGIWICASCACSKTLFHLAQPTQKSCNADTMSHQHLYTFMTLHWCHIWSVVTCQYLLNCYNSLPGVVLLPLAILLEHLMSIPYFLNLHQT